MSAIHFNERRPAQVKRPLSAALLAASLAIAAGCSVSVAGPAMWRLMARGQETSPTLAACAAIPSGPDRLACYDQLGKEQPPAKGAFAPVTAR